MYETATIFFLLLHAVLAGLQDMLENHLDVPAEEELKYVLRSTITHDVLLVSDNERSDDKAEKIVDFVGKFSQKIAPTQIYPVGDETLNSTLSDLRLATSRTLVIYVYGAAEMDFVGKAHIIKDYVTVLSHYAHVPRILLILVLDQVRVDTNLTLRQLWSFDYVDVVVFEVPPIWEEEGEREVLLPRLHRFNLFKNDYTVVTDIFNVVNWYPDKSKDMNGYPFKFFGDVNLTRGQIDSIFQQCMNFTTVFSISLDDFDMILIPTSMVYDNSSATFLEYSAPIEESKWCLYTPRIPINKRLFSLRNISVAVTLGIVITLIFWVLSILMNFDKSLRHPMNTIAVLFSAPIPTMPNRLVERIFFLTLIAVSVQYISIFYTELFGAFVVPAGDMNIKKWKNVIEIDLPTHVITSFYDRLKEKYAGIRTVIQDRTYHADIFFREESEILSPIVNKSCLILNEIGDMYLLDNELGEKSQGVMRLTDLCIYTTPVAYILRTRSPYNNRLNDILLRVSESRVNRMPDLSHTSLKQRMYQSEIDALEHNQLVERYIVAIIIGAYVISFITFVAEVVIALLKCRRVRFYINRIFSRAHMKQ